MLVKNLNNAYFRDNVENDDVKNTGFNLFLFKDTIVKIEFDWYQSCYSSWISQYCGKARRWMDFTSRTLGAGLSK